MCHFLEGERGKGGGLDEGGTRGRDSALVLVACN
jgi:hypothetical protein